MNRKQSIWVLLAVSGFLLSACGGGGGGSTTGSTPAPSIPAKVLSWQPPGAYTDNTPLNPGTDLQCFEIYVRQDAAFGPDDAPAASASPVDTSFNLALLAPSLSRGTTYYVSVRAVSATGLKSDFSPSASFAL